MKKNTWILIVAIIGIAVLFWDVNKYFLQKDGAIVVVTVDDKEIGSYSLLEDQKIELNGGTNTLVIQDGFADMIEAKCPDKLCVDQKKISKDGETIICLPNKLVVSVKSVEEREFDSITN